MLFLGPRACTTEGIDRFLLFPRVSFSFARPTSPSFVKPHRRRSPSNARAVSSLSRIIGCFSRSVHRAQLVLRARRARIIYFLLLFSIAPPPPPPHNPVPLLPWTRVLLPFAWPPPTSCAQAIYRLFLLRPLSIAPTSGSLHPSPACPSLMQRAQLVLRVRQHWRVFGFFSLRVTPRVSFLRVSVTLETILFPATELFTSSHRSPHTLALTLLALTNRSPSPLLALLPSRVRSFSRFF